jgi:outer membrane protein OmpA-like peptidoglycan-associated protein
MKKHTAPSTATLILLAALPPVTFAQSTAPSSALSYVGANTRIGVGFDSEFKGRGEITQTLTATETSALIGELWAARHRAGGLQLQYNWLSGSLGDLANARVHKVFAAIDQNVDRARKITVGYGQEIEAYHWAAYLSKGLNKSILTGTSIDNLVTTATGTDTTQGPFTQATTTTTTTQLFAKPYEWAIGARAGKWYANDLVRFTGGLDYEWAEASNRQVSISLQAEKYFAHSPFSVSLSGGIGKRSGPLVTDSALHFGQVMVRYDLFGQGRLSNLNQGAGWRAPSQVKRMETVTEMRTEMKAETKVTEVPVQVQIPASVAAPTSKVEQRVVRRSESRAAETYFDLGKSGLPAKSTSELDALLAGLKAAGQSCSVSFTVEGHTCPTGPDRNNLALSQKRADAVKAYLAKNGITNASIATEGKAGRAPKYPEVRGQTFRNRRADTIATITCDATENVTVSVPGETIAARTETRMEKRSETVQVPVQVPVQVQREVIDSVPVSWVPRALGATISHPQTVSMYTASKSTVASSTAPRVYTNQCPNPAADVATVAANSTANAIDVLANDRDPDGNALSIASVSQPAHGTATISGGKVLYTPAAGYSGADSFTYTVTDGYCGTKSATVSLTVTAANAGNNAPVCRNLSYSFQCATGTDIDLKTAVTDKDGDAITYTMPARGLYGTLVNKGNGLFTYTANKSVCFDREFVTYTATDSKGATCTGQVELIDPKQNPNVTQ